MRVCIDARNAKAGMTGVGRYAINLVRHLAGIDTCNEYVVLRHSTYGRQIVEQENFSEVVLPYEISTARHLLCGQRVVDRLDVDLYHSLFHMLPLRLRSRQVVITL